MSDSSSQDKTERATPKRIREARERGEIPRSRELASFVVVASGLMTLMSISASLAGGAADWMHLISPPDPQLWSSPPEAEVQMRRQVPFWSSAVGPQAWPMQAEASPAPEGQQAGSGTEPPQQAEP